MQITIAIVLIVLTAIIAYLGGVFYSRYQQMRSDLQAIKDHKRHTYSTADGLLDATAVTIDVLLDEQVQSDLRQARIRQLQKILNIVQSGPMEYDSERPAGERPGKKGKRQ